MIFFYLCNYCLVPFDAVKLIHIQTFHANIVFLFEYESNFSAKVPSHYSDACMIVTPSIKNNNSSFKYTINI